MKRKENRGVVKMQDQPNVSHTFGKLVKSGLHLALDPQDDSCCLPCFPSLTLMAPVPS